MSDDDRNITPTRVIEITSSSDIQPPKPKPCGVYWQRWDDGAVEIGGCFEMHDGTVYKVGTALYLSPELADAFVGWVKAAQEDE